MSCSKRISETASDPSYIYQIFSCVVDEAQQYLDRLKFFKQAKDEIERISVYKQSPEIVALVADWGQGKSSLLDIIEEYTKNNNASVIKMSFKEIIQNPKGILNFKNGVYLIDEVESLIDYYSEYEREIKEFWDNIKELANSEGNSVVYLSMTPSAYSKIFGVGGHLYSLLPETYPALTSRIRTVNIQNPSKLEFLTMLKCMLKMSEVKDSDILKYMDLPFWVIDPERRKYVRFFNDILCTNYPNVDKIFNELARSDKGRQLNAEGETVKLDSLTGLENSLDENELRKLRRVLMSRIFSDKNLIIKPIEKNIVKGFLIPYSRWLELFPKGSDVAYVEDFILTINDNKISVFISDEIDKVVFEGFDTSKIKDTIRKLIPLYESEAYALQWSFFESLVNTNVGGLIVEFKSREIRDKALEFVNSSITDINKQMDAIENFIELNNIKILDKERVGRYSRLLKVQVSDHDVISIILVKATNSSEIDEIIEEISESNEIIHGCIIVDLDIDSTKLMEFLNSLAIPFVKIDLSTPKKRQLLYLLYSKIYGNSRVRFEAIDLRLGDIKNSINAIVSEILGNIEVRKLPIPKNKRLIQSINWLIFYPNKEVSNVEVIFEKVNEIVNEKFRIYGSKQFHLEDIETAETFKEDIINYFVSNDILKTVANYVDFSSYLGDYVNNFSKLLAGFMKQKFKDNAEDMLVNYILFYADIIDKRKDISKANPLIFSYQIFSPDNKIGQNPTLDFLTYLSIVSGEVARKLDYSEVYEKLVDYVKKISEKLNNPYLAYGYFITAKRRGAGIRSLTEMKEVLENYEKGCITHKDIRLCYCYLSLSKVYLDLLNQTEVAVNEAERIVNHIENKLEVAIKATKYINVNEEIDEVKQIRNLINSIKMNFERYMVELSKKIQQINESKETELFKKHLDYLISAINLEGDLNLYLLLFKLMSETLNGVRVSIDELNGTIVERIISLAKIGDELRDLETLIGELEKISPELPRLRDSIEKKREKLSQLITEIHEVIKSHEIA